MTCTACGAVVPPGVAECLGCGRAVPVLSSANASTRGGGTAAPGAGLGTLPPPGNASFGGTPFGDQQFTRIEDGGFGDIFFGDALIDGAGHAAAAVAPPTGEPARPDAPGRSGTDRGTRLALVAVLTVLAALVATGLVWFFANVSPS